jgi:hypothetical protein
MAREHVDGEIQSGVKSPQSKKPGSGLNFWKMITFAAGRGIADPLKGKEEVEGDASSACSVDTNSSAHTVGWLTYFRDIPIAGLRMHGSAVRHRVSLLKRRLFIFQLRARRGLSSGDQDGILIRSVQEHVLE